MREFDKNTFQIQLRTEIWSHFGFNLIEKVLETENEIFFVLEFPILDVSPAMLAAFREAVGKLLGIGSNQVGESIILFYSRQLDKWFVGIKIPSRAARLDELDWWE